MNYCCYCGAKLMVNAKFCSNCGEPVPSEEDQPIGSSVPENVLDVQISDTTVDNASISPYVVKFCKRELKFDPRFEEYNKLRRRYFDRGNTLTQKFVSYYKANVHDFDTLFDKGLESFIANAKEFLEFSVSIAHEYGSLDVDMEWYLQFSDEAVGFCSVMNYYRDISVQLIGLAETMASYRAAKSSRQSYWQGGGFGIAGAIKGALTATALNLGSDMMRSIGNEIGNSSDRAKLRKLEQNVYQERDHCEYLTRALDSWFEAMWRVTENVLKQHNLVPDFDSGSALMPILEADDIVHNATTNTPDSEYDRAIDLICQGLPHDPYCSIMAYTVLYQIPQTDKNEIQEFVQFLGIEAEYNVKKNEIVEKLIAPILEMPESTVAQIDKKLNALKNLQNKFSDVNISQYTGSLEEKKEEVQQANGEAIVDYEAIMDFYQEDADSSSSSQKSSSGCFITSAVCRTFNKPDNCYELTAFRSFRDNWLAKQSDGQTLIQEYYQIAPTIVEHIDQQANSKKIYQSIWDTYLVPCLRYIEAQQFIQCKSVYISMVKQLRNQFC